MDLLERYQREDNTYLVGMIEVGAPDFSESALEAARAVLRQRGVDQSEMTRIARQRLKDQIWTYLENFDVINDTLELPTSKFLNEEEVKLLFQQIFSEWKEKYDQMIPDSWHYIIAAAFG